MKYIPHYMIGMFTYGFIRGMRSKYDEPNNLLGTRIVYSVGNGFIYASPFGLKKIIDTIDRLDVYITDKDKEKYKSIYEEGMGKNMNTLL